MKNSLSAICALSLSALLVASQPELITDIYQDNINRNHFIEREADSPKVFDREYDIVVPRFQSPIEVTLPPQADPSLFNTSCRADSIDYRSHQGRSPYAAKKGNVISRARIV